ncbi:hypothetical protein NMG60_11016457 [Bertholletia excelsa]
MKGQKSAVGSFPETLGFDPASTSNDEGVDQHMLWNNIPNSAQTLLPDYVTSASDPNRSYVSSMSQGGWNLNGWSVGEPSSSGTQDHAGHNAEKTEHRWSLSTVACDGAGPVLGQHSEPANTFSLNNNNANHSTSQLLNAPLFVQGSSNAIPQDLNMNAGFVRHGGVDSQMTDRSNTYKSDLPGGMTVPSNTSCDPFGSYLVEENDERPGSSLDGRRLPCKRKAFEGNCGQSSTSGSSNYYQPAEHNVWHAIPGQCSSSGSSLSISIPSENVRSASPSEQVNARFGLGSSGATSERPLTLNVAGNANDSHRNFRVRTNHSPSQTPDLVPFNVFPGGTTIGHSDTLSQQQSSRHAPRNNSLDIRLSSPSENACPQRPPIFMHVPTLHQTPQSSRWSEGSSSRAGHLSNSGERNALLHNESDSITLPRNVSEHCMFEPVNEIRNSAQGSGNWSLTGANVASSSRMGSSSGTRPLPGPNWGPHRNSSQYSRRLSELVRQQLLSSNGPESAGQSSGNSSVHLGSSSQEVGLSAGASNRGHRLSRSRAMLLDRQLDIDFGIPSSLRTLAAASEGRSRLVSEIRNVLDVMRRGEGLRFEDVMILDRSGFFGMTDIHDRHRDLRLDVDNMSYEELLALEERIGNVNTGLSEETILDRLKQRKFFSIAIGTQMELEPCCICQEEYNDGEDLGTLECGHEFHSGCIKQWLMHKNLCPICKATALTK